MDRARPNRFCPHNAPSLFKIVQFSTVDGSKNIHNIAYGCTEDQLVNKLSFDDVSELEKKLYSEVGRPV